MTTRYRHQVGAASLTIIVLVSLASPFVALSGAAAGQSLAGSVDRATGAPAASDVVFAATDGSEPSYDELSAQGAYNLTGLQSNATYDVSYLAANGSQPGAPGAFPRDGSPDVFALQRASPGATADLGNAALPGAHVVNLSVVNETGAPVSGAAVAFQHTNANGATVNTSQFGEWFLTEADGDVHLSNGTAGIELTGNVTVAVAPPRQLSYDGGLEGEPVSSSSGYVQRVYTTRLDVTGDETVTVTLESAEQPGATMTANETAPALGEPVNVSLSNITGETPSFYTWTVDGSYAGYTTHPNASLVLPGFSAPGPHTVAVTARSGSEQFLFEESLTLDAVTAGDGTLTAAPTPARANLDTVRFALVNVSGVGDGDFYTWTFGDGDRTYTRHPNATANHTYAEPGAYNATVRVRDNSTEALLVEDTLRLDVTAAGNGTLVATPDSLTEGESVAFAVRNVSLAAGQSVGEYRWDFDGDGTADATTAANETSHAYADPGTYDAAVTVTNANGTPLFTASAAVDVAAEEFAAPTDGWPQFGYDDANTGANVAGVGPAGPVEVRWNETTSTLYSRPPTFADGRVFVASGYGIVAYDAANGSTLWSASAYPDEVTAPPTVEGDSVFVSSHNDAANNERDTLTVFDAADGSERWSVSVPADSDGLFTDGEWLSAPTVTSDAVYVVSEAEDALYAIDRGSHSLRWRKNLTELETTGDAQAVPAVANGTVYVTQGWDGSRFTGFGSHLYAFDADTGTEQWNRSLSNHRGAAPTVSDGVLYVSTYGSLVAFDADTGAQLWSVAAGETESRSSPAVADGIVVDTRGGFYDDEKGVVAVATNGSRAWSYDTDSAVLGAPAVLGDTVYVAEFDGTVHALDLQTGAPVWNDSLDAPGFDTTVASAVVGGDGWLYVQTGSSSDINRSLVALGDVEPLASVSGSLSATPADPRRTVENVTFETTVSGDADSVETYRWSFGDGATAETTARNVSHAYDRTGTYTARVSGFDSYDRKLYTATTAVTVRDIGSADLRVAPTPADVNVTNVSFAVTNRSLPASVTDVRYGWSFGDGETVFTSANRTNHTYAALGDAPVSVEVLDGTTEQTLVTLSTTVPVVDRVPPTVSASAPSPVRTGGNFSVVASATDNHRVANYTFETDEGQSMTTAANRTNLSLATAGAHTVTVTATDASGNSNATTLVVNASAAPDLEPRISVEPAQTLGNDRVTANVTVVNDGTAEATDVDVRLVARSRVGYYDDASTTYTRAVGTVAAGANETVTVDLTDWLRGNLSSAYPDVELVAVSDPDGAVAEGDETDNRTTATTEVSYADLRLTVNAPWRVIPTEAAETRVYVRNYGNAPSDARTAELDFGDGSSNETLAVPALDPRETAVFTRNHTFATGRHTLVASVADPDAPRGNADRDVTTSQPYELRGRLSAADPVQVGRNVTVYGRGYSNYESNVTANLSLPAGLEFAPGETATKYDTDDRTYFEWTVVATANRDATYDLELNLSARGENETATERLTVERPKTRVVDTAAVNFTGTGSDSATLTLRNETTYEHGVTISTHLGTDGRTLAGLDYLVEYPHACVEQTTSPMLGALYTGQYYRRNPAPGGYDTGQINASVDAGVARLTTGQDAQHENGSWSMYGNDPDGDVFYTAYALFGTSAVGNDPVQSARAPVRADLDRIDANATVAWLADEQAADGRIRNDKFYFDDDAAMTGFTLVALDQAGPYNATAAATADQLRGDAASYLVTAQRADGAWGDGSTPNTMSTALAVWGLEASGVETAPVRTAIDDGRAWLLDNQADSGAWSQRRSASWSDVGTSSETTAYALMALNATGLENTNASVQAGQTYLVTVYDDRGSWGYTRATALAINTLLTLGQGGSNPTHDVTVTFGTESTPALVTKTIDVDSTDALDSVELTESELQTLRDNADGPITVQVDTTGTGVLVVGLENDQLVARDEYAANEGGA